jgi:hypothetical protein
MRTHVLKEPNPAAGRPLTTRFFTELAEYLEATSSIGREYGLLPPRPREKHVLADLDTPDVLRLPTLRAIGERGLPLIVEPEDLDGRIRPLDTRELPAGPHTVYACLGWDRVECGPVEEHSSQDGVGGARIATYRRAPIVLAAGEKRLNYRDWLAVAEIERTRSNGALRTVLNTRFHPPVLSMQAYALPNPLVRLADVGLGALEDLGLSPEACTARVEAAALRNIAETASPVVAFLQTQRCLAYLRAANPPGLVLDGRLENDTFAHATFCEFLARLAEDLCHRIPLELYPATLEVDGSRFQRLSGELVEEENFWAWISADPKFVANGFALYFPRVVARELPQLRYGRRKGDLATFAAPVAAQNLSASGSVLILADLNDRVDRVYLTGTSGTAHERLRKLLENGHALYYR